MSVIRILHPLEIREYETPPLFDSFNRKKFLTLPAVISAAELAHFGILGGQGLKTVDKAVMKF